MLSADVKTARIGAVPRDKNGVYASPRISLAAEAQMIFVVTTMYTGQKRGESVMKPSIDLHKKNELEMVIDMCEKLLSDKPGGIIFNKGTEFESKLSYKKALEGVKTLRSYFGLKGAFSLSICKTCERWNNTGHSNKAFGTCPKGNMKHQYETCVEHTLNKETWGL